MPNENKEIKNEDKREEKTKYVSVSVDESKKSPRYWNAIGYRLTRLAKFELLGYGKILKFLDGIADLKIPAADGESKKTDPSRDFLLKTLVRYFLSTWLFSEHNQFEKLTVEAVQEELNCITQQALKKGINININPDALKKLHADLKDIRNRWKKDIPSPRLTLKFMKEPDDRKFEDYVNKIRNNQWEKLDYNDKDFLRNITKCLRKELITTDELLTAQMLYASYQRFGNLKEMIGEHRYNRCKRLLDYTTASEQPKFQQPLFHVLAYQLEFADKKNEAVALTFLQFFTEHFSLEKHFYWKKDKLLYFKKEEKEYHLANLDTAKKLELLQEIAINEFLAALSNPATNHASVYNKILLSIASVSSSDEFASRYLEKLPKDTITALMNHTEKIEPSYNKEDLHSKSDILPINYESFLSVKNHLSCSDNLSNRMIPPR